MNKKEANIINILADMNTNNLELTPEQEQLFQQALQCDNEIIKKLITNIKDIKQ